jgi:UDP-N-acetyl-D-galactosamine dehydrogenase
VAHRAYEQYSADAIVAKLVTNGVYVDVKSRADAAALRERGIQVWRL